LLVSPLKQDGRATEMDIRTFALAASVNTHVKFVVIKLTAI